MHAHTTDGWGDLFLAEAGASAALAGLLFVAISINLTKILEVRGLVGRAGEAIVLLVAVLIVSTLMLVPDQPRVALGTELLVTGLLAWSILVVIHARAVRGGIGPCGRCSSPGSRWPNWPSFRSWSPGCRCCCRPVAGSTGWSRGRHVLGGRGAQRVGTAHRDPAVSPRPGGMTGEPADTRRHAGA